MCEFRFADNKLRNNGQDDRRNKELYRFGGIFSNFRIESSDEKEIQLFGLRCFERMNELETRPIFKKEIWQHFSGRKMFLYVLLFVTPGHPTRENKVNTLTMLTDRYVPALIQNHC